MPTLLMPNGCDPTGLPFCTTVPLASVKTSGVNGVGAAPLSQNCRKYLKSAKMVKYLSQRSRSNEPYRYSRSVGATAGVRSAKLNAVRSAGKPFAAPAIVYSGSVFWFGNACGVGVNRLILKGGFAPPRKNLL